MEHEPSRPAFARDRRHVRPLPNVACFGQIDGIHWRLQPCHSRSVRPGVVVNHSESNCIETLTVVGFFVSFSSSSSCASSDLKASTEPSSSGVTGPASSSVSSLSDSSFLACAWGSARKHHELRHRSCLLCLLGLCGFLASRMSGRGLKAHGYLACWVRSIFCLVVFIVQCVISFLIRCLSLRVFLDVLSLLTAVS